YATDWQRSNADIRIHIVKIGDYVYYRKRVGIDPWSSWARSVTTGLLRFTASGGSGSIDYPGDSWIHVGWIRFNSIGALSTAVGSGDFDSDNAFYREAEGVWYFSTAGSLSWLDSQAFARAHRGDLVRVGQHGDQACLRW